MLMWAAGDVAEKVGEEFPISSTGRLYGSDLDGMPEHDPKGGLCSATNDRVR